MSRNDLQSIVEVCDDVRDVLDADRDLHCPSEARQVSAAVNGHEGYRRRGYTYTNEIRGDARSELFLLRKLLMGRCRWMDDERLCVAW